MTTQEINGTIAEALHQIAPEADLSTIGPDDDLRDAFDLDSFDFLNLIIAIHAKTGVDIPESDYGKVGTLGRLTGYIEQHATS
jgi:acyl carrier protein